MSQAETEKQKTKLWFSYQWITSNIGFFLFLSMLAIVYIANGHMADKTIRDTNKITKEIKELQFEYKTIKSEIMYKSREEAIVRSAEPLGLKISNTPPGRLKINSEKPVTKTN